MKKSFILYTDQGEIIDSLTDSQAGKLIKAIFDFQKGKNPELPPALRSVFISFKQTLVRDNEKWENIRERNIENGKLGGRPRKTQNNPKNPNGYFGNPKNLVSVNVNDNVSVKKDSKTKNTFSSYKENRSTNDLRDTYAEDNQQTVVSPKAGLTSSELEEKLWSWAEKISEKGVKKNV